MLIAATLAASCSRSPALIGIEDSCGTFVSEFAPQRTPLLEKAHDGTFTLTTSFTPSKNREADRIVKAVERGPVRIRITQTGRELQALALREGRLLVRVASKQEAQ